MPGAAEFAYPIAEFEQAQRLRAALDELHRDAPVTVVGAGLTGIETAAELAEQGRKVTLVCGGRLGPSLSEPGRRSVAKVLAKLRVAVLEADVVTEVRRRRGRPRRRRRAPERADHLDRRLRRARPGRRPAACAPTRWAGCSPTRR